MDMELIENQHFTGERALYQSKGLKLVGCLFDDGESPLKESKDLEIVNTRFAWKYPLWYGKGFVVRDCQFDVMSRAGIWYSKDMLFANCHFDSPKMFRRSSNIVLEDVSFSDAQETLYFCKGIKLKNVKADNAPYFCLGCKDLEIDGLSIEGNYAFDSCKNMRIKNSKLHTKDAFWNCEDLYIEDSIIEGEYFGWNSKNVTLKNCTIRSHQGFCYIENLTLINCKVEDSDLTFEYCSNIEAEVVNVIDSVKNPISGHIKALGIKELVRDGNPDMDPKDTIIEVLGEDGIYHEI